MFGIRLSVVETMDKRNYLEWIEKENNIYTQSIIALIAAIIASKVEGISVFGQPCNWGISISLFIFCFLLRIKYHLLEPRLREFYTHLVKTQSDREKSKEQIREELYIYTSYMLCFSIFHFFIFLVVFLIFVFICRSYNKTYLNYQMSKKPDWGKGKFKPERLFDSWVSTDNLEIILTFIALLLTIIFGKYFNLTAYLLIIALLIIEIAVDWFLTNRNFYLDYFENEI
jgi:hypothetical protein